MVGQEESGGEKGGNVDREEDKRRQVALNRLRQRQLLEEQRQWRARGHEEELTYAQVGASIEYGWAHTGEARLDQITNQQAC